MAVHLTTIVQFAVVVTDDSPSILMYRQSVSPFFLSPFRPFFVALSRSISWSLFESREKPTNRCEIVEQPCAIIKRITIAFNEIKSSEYSIWSPLTNSRLFQLPSVHGADKMAAIWSVRTGEPRYAFVKNHR